jgi:orotidine-5'-phosphate decarboxylase
MRRIERLSRYLRVYGTEEARKYVVENFGALDHKIIGMDRSIIPACDVETIEEFEELVKQTADVKGIGGFKVGFELGLGYGLPKVVETVRKYSDKPIIYDHQKAGTDIPDTGRNFARVCKKAGIDTVILFPQAGPETGRAWIYHALDNGLKVIVGGRMTHPAYTVSEGGFITDEGALEMYRIAVRAGINNFVAPGNKPDVIKQVKELIEAEGVSPVFYAPGFVAQGGKIEEAAKVAGERWHAIVGKGIYKAKDMKKAAEEHASKL